MVYKTFPHKADIGIRGIGKTITESFSEIAKCLFLVQTDIKKIKSLKKVKIKVKAKNIEELLIEFLNSLLLKSTTKEMFFSQFKIKIIKPTLKLQKDFILECEAMGEKINPKKHELKLEVKACTYSELKVYEFKKGKDKKWISQCVVDV